MDPSLPFCKRGSYLPKTNYSNVGHSQMSLRYLPHFAQGGRTPLEGRMLPVESKVITFRPVSKYLW